MDWQFRILSGSASDFAADLNAMIMANGYPAVMPTDPVTGAATWNGQQSVVLPPIGVIRLDFDTFMLPSGLHINARVSALPGSDDTAVAQDEGLWAGAIAAWFGQGGEQPAYPTLANYTNTAPALYPSNGGQVWASTGKTVLISPAPAVQKRVWA